MTDKDVLKEHATVFRKGNIVVFSFLGWSCKGIVFADVVIDEIDEL